MDIEVERIINEKNELVFTITVKDIKELSYGEEIDDILKSVGKLKNVHFRQSVFQAFSEHVESCIHNRLEYPFKMISCELYKFFADNQPMDTKKWLKEINAQGVKFYFHNDMHPDKLPNDQESEHDE